MANSHAPPRAAPNPFEIDHDQAKNQAYLGLTSNGSATGKTLQKKSKTSGAGSSSSHDTASGDEADEDEEVGEEDEDEDDDDGDGDAFAPSGLTIQVCEDQAGPHGDEQCDSDDEAYNAVDDIIDSDADEPHLERVEEKEIMESEEDNGFGTVTTFSAPSFTDVWEGFDVEDGLFSLPFDDECLGRSGPDFLGNQTELFESVSAFGELDPVPSLPPSPPSTKRRVHFDEPISPTTESSVTGDEDLNGLFNSGHMDFDMEVTFENLGCDDEDDSSSKGSCSGYETDYGDTTDEEGVPATATTCPRSLIRQPSPSSLNIDGQPLPSAGLPSFPSPFKVPATPVRGPRMGTFNVSFTKGFAMFDATSNKVMVSDAMGAPRADGICTQGPSTRSSTANASPVLSHPVLGTPLIQNGSTMGDFSNHGPPDPMLAVGSESMADILQPTGSASHTRNSSQTSGNVYYPIEFDAIYAADDQDDDDDDGQDYLLNVEDFIDFGVDSSSDDGEGDLDASLPTPASTSPTVANVRPSMPTANNLATHDLMVHLDKGMAGAFRQGQIQHRQRSRRLSSGQLLCEEAFKQALHAPATSPVIPPNKRKLSGGFASTASFGSPTKKRLMNHV